jgi:hypothetical protein
MLYSLVLQFAALELQRRFPLLVINKWFFDDGTIGGSREDIAGALDYLRSDEMRSLGLYLNSAPHKTKAVYAHTDADAAASANYPPLSAQLGLPEENINRHPDGNFMLLGAPIGNVGFIHAKLLAAATEHHELLSRAEQAFHPFHLRATTTRYTTNFCKLVYFLRCTPPSEATARALGEFTKQQRALWANMGIDMSDSEFQQAQLPVYLGGMGLTNAADVHAAAYLASVKAAESHGDFKIDPAQLQPICDSINSRVHEECIPLVRSEDDRETMQIGGEGWVQLTPNTSPKTQGFLTRWLAYSSLQQLSAANDNTARLLRSISDSHAGSWLNVKPDSYWRLSNDAFIIAINIRLGRGCFTEAGHLCPVCKVRIKALDEKDAREGKAGRTVRHPVRIDHLGAHALKCAYGGGRIARHDNLAFEIAQIARAANKSVTREQNVTIELGGKDRKADFVVHSMGATGKHVAVDVGITFGGHSNLINQATLCDPTAAADAYARQKDGKSKGAVEANGDMEFVPVTVSHHGVWGNRAHTFLHHLGKLASARIADPHRAARARYQMYAKLSVCIQRQNALMIMQRRGPRERKARIDMSCG